MPPVAVGRSYQTSLPFGAEALDCPSAKGRRLSEAVASARSAGDSIELRLKRAQDAADRAREAEERAVEAAQEAEERSDHALHVSERGRARVDEVDRETAREQERRIKKAEGPAAAPALSVALVPAIQSGS